MYKQKVKSHMTYRHDLSRMVLATSSSTKYQVAKQSLEELRKKLEIE